MNQEAKDTANDRPQPISITRREYFSEMSLVWMILTMILLELSNRADGRKKTGVFIVSAVAFTFWMISIVRLNRENKSQRNIVLPPLSDDLKIIAQDPSRKIEAVKAYKDQTGVGLADARRAVEEYIACLGVKTPENQ